MSKRVLDASAQHCSSSSSSSSVRSRHRRPRFKLLEALPAALFAEVCSFLSVYQVLSTLRSTCLAMDASVQSDCLLQSHLDISSRALIPLSMSSHRTQALVSRIPSLFIVYTWDDKAETALDSVHPLLVLRHPVDESRFLFSSLWSLHAAFRLSGECCPRNVAVWCLRQLLQLLAADAASLSCLRRLVIEDDNLITDEACEEPFSALAALSSLTHCSVHLQEASALSCSTLVSAVSSLQYLTSLSLSGRRHAWPGLLSLLCADAAIPLLLRLKTLVLPYAPGDGNQDELHDAFLCRLSSLPAPAALEHFSGAPNVSYRAAGLLSVFSLPHLMTLGLPGTTRRSQFAAFVSSLRTAPAALDSLLLPNIQSEPDDGAREEAAVQEDAAAVANAARTLLSRFTALRRLCCDGETASGAAAVSGSRPSDGASGCSGSLYTLQALQTATLSPFRFTAPLSFPLLTKLHVEPALSDAELELLLPACPRLLRLNCVVLQSWDVVLMAARHCRCLLELSVHAAFERPPARDAAAAPHPDVSGPFLPQLITLKLDGCRSVIPPFDTDFSVLRHFTSPPHAQLLHVALDGVGLTAERVLSLHCLPRLSHLVARRSTPAGDSGGVEFPEVEEAHTRARQQLLSRAAAGNADADEHRPVAFLDDWEATGGESALGPHQQREMRRRVLRDAEQVRWRDSPPDLLESVKGLPKETVRAVFFAELRSVITAATAESLSARQ